MHISNPVLKPIVEFSKKMVFRYTPFGKPHYPYPCIEPIELSTLVLEIERLRGRPGVICEIGVARGMTTRFLAEHIRASGTGDRILAIDTFDSFVDSDVAYEVEHRGKSRSAISGFAYNDFQVWKDNFREFPFVEAIQADCSKLDYQAIGPVKIALLDVDLYLPIKNTLPRLYDALVEGGVILVDDVKSDQTYDGAFQAYKEFCEARGMALQIIGNKGGVIRKVDASQTL